MKKKDLAGSRRKIREVLPSLPTSEPLSDGDISSKDKKKREVRRDKKTEKTSSLCTSSFQNRAWSVTLSGRWKEIDDLPSLSSIEKRKKYLGFSIKVLQRMQESFAKAVDYRT